MNRETLTSKHELWDKNISNWEFYIRSYLGGNDYKNGYYLHRYVLESPEDYDQRIRHTPLDNHCKNVVQIYTSFLWRVSPTRDYGSLDGDEQLSSFLADADLDGMRLNINTSPEDPAGSSYAQVSKAYIEVTYTEAVAVTDNSVFFGCNF